MKLHLIIVLFSAFASLCLGQTPSASPEKSKSFGSSLEKYKNKEKENFQNKHFQNKQKSDDADDGETIRIKTDLVVNDVLVTDQNGKMITNLKKEDFIVVENGVPQAIEMFSPGENATVPRSIVLIIDYFVAQAPYFKNSIEAAKLLVDKLAAQDKMAIVTIDVKLRLDFTQDKTLLKKTLDSLEKNLMLETLNWKRSVSGKAREFLDSLGNKAVTPGTGLEFDTLLAVLNEMFNDTDRQRMIIFQGDGSEIIWLKEDKDMPFPVSDSMRWTIKYVPKEKQMRRFGFSDLKEAIERSRATIYSVIPGIRFLGFSREEQKSRAKISFINHYRALGMREEYFLMMKGTFQEPMAKLLLAGQTAMFRAAELSGGFTGFIEKPEDAENVYSEIFKQISNRYVIGYYPANQQQDGKRREVKVEVRNHPEYVVTGRKAYFPQ
jgi:VWFA-related protein